MNQLRALVCQVLCLFFNAKRAECVHADMFVTVLRMNASKYYPICTANYDSSWVLVWMDI